MILLPLYIIFPIAVAILLFGIQKKMILMTNMASIALVAIGLFGMIYGFPCLTGTVETAYVNGTTITTNTITNQTDFVVETTSIITAMIGIFMLIYVNFKQWEELNL